MAGGSKYNVWRYVERVMMSRPTRDEWIKACTLLARRRQPKVSPCGRADRRVIAVCGSITSYCLAPYGASGSERTSDFRGMRKHPAAVPPTWRVGSERLQAHGTPPSPASIRVQANLDGFPRHGVVPGEVSPQNQDLTAGAQDWRMYTAIYCDAWHRQEDDKRELLAANREVEQREPASGKQNQ